MKAERAAALGIARISDLAAHPELRFAFSNEFMDRADGWRGLRAAYQLPQRNVRGVDHEIAYRGLDAGDADVVDLYSTDPEIVEHGLRAARRRSPPFSDLRRGLAVPRRASRAARPTPSRSSTRSRAGSRAPAMIAMNLRAKRDRVAEETIAAEFIAHELGAPPTRTARRTPARARRLAARARTPHRRASLSGRRCRCCWRSSSRSRSASRPRDGRRWAA